MFRGSVEEFSRNTFLKSQTATYSRTYLQTHYLFSEGRKKMGINLKTGPQPGEARNILLLNSLSRFV